MTTPVFRSYKRKPTERQSDLFSLELNSLKTDSTPV